MPSIFGTHPFLILLFIVINLIGTFFILRQAGTIATKPYKRNHLALIIKGLCILFSLCALASTTNLLADSINYVRFAKRPITTNYSVTKKEKHLSKVLILHLFSIQNLILNNSSNFVKG